MKQPTLFTVTMRVGFEQLYQILKTQTRTFSVNPIFGKSFFFFLKHVNITNELSFLHRTFSASS